MIESAKNKQIEKSDAKESGDPYFFPEHQITVRANSIKEAQEKVEHILKSKQGNTS